MNKKIEIVLIVITYLRLILYILPPTFIVVQIICIIIGILYTIFLVKYFKKKRNENTDLP